MLKYFLRVCAVKLDNPGCKKCVSWEKLNNGQWYCCHKDNETVKADPLEGKYTQLKNNSIHKIWNRKLKCKRFEKLSEVNL